MTLVTLVVGGDAAAREEAIAAQLRPFQQTGRRVAVILEGASQADPFFLLGVQVFGLAPACPCCVGNLTMRVTLNRILRQPPERLYIGIMQAEHLDALREFLMHPPYDQYLTLTENLIVKDK